MKQFNVMVIDGCLLVAEGVRELLKAKLRSGLIAYFYSVNKTKQELANGIYM